MNVELQCIWMESWVMMLFVIYGIDEVVFFVDRVVVMQSWLGWIGKIVDILLLCLCFLDVFIMEVFYVFEDEIMEVLDGY